MPWIDRATLNHLREQNANLADALVRLARKEVGLPEQPAQPRKERVVMDSRVVRLVQAWDGAHNQRREEARAWALYDRLKDWDAVVAEMTPAEAED